MSPKKLTYNLVIIIILLLMPACGKTAGVPTPTQAELSTPLPPTSTLAPTLTPTPTATPLPLAARVNGQGITLAEFQAELKRYQSARQASGMESASNDQQVVLDNMINLTLLAQGAEKAGYRLDDAALQERIDKLKAQMGGDQALADWLTARQFTDTGFRQALQREAEAAWMRDQIATSVPSTTEQVHVRQILLYNEDDAKSVLNQLKSGAKFTGLALKFDPINGGELPWFPRGYLPHPALEAAAFALQQPDQMSDIIQTPAGYHILQLIERDPRHPLDPDARRALQEKALQEWLKTQRSQSEIQILLP